LPLSKASRKALASVHWKGADPAAVLAGLPASFDTRSSIPTWE